MRFSLARAHSAWARPGAWMEGFKQFLAFPMYAAAAWLVWVLSQQVTPEGLFRVLIGLICLALAAWAFGIEFEARSLLLALPVMLLAALMLSALGLVLSVYVRQLENFAGTMYFGLPEKPFPPPPPPPPPVALCWNRENDLIELPFVLVTVIVTVTRPEAPPRVYP